MLGAEAAFRRALRRGHSQLALELHRWLLEYWWLSANKQAHEDGW